MAIIKKTDIAEKGILDDYIKKVNEATVATKKLQDQVRGVNQTGTGSEAKERLELAKALTEQTKKLVQSEKVEQEQIKKQILANQKLNKAEQERIKTEQAQLRLAKQQEQATKKLKNAFTAEERVKQQVLKANAKLAESRSKAAKDLALVRQKTLQANKALREQSKAALGVKKSFSGLGKQLIGAAGIAGGFTLFIGILKNAFKIMLEFSKAASGLAAILQKNKSEIKALTEQAKELGRTTAFTASEVIKLQTELARLGFEINEIRDSTPAILDLAAALEVNLADAAMVAGGIVRAFGLSTKDTKEVVDSMVATLNNSGASFESYRETVKLAAPIFKAANIDFKTMNLLIGNLADSQIKGSLAGTGLKNLISKLADENSKLSKELGFTVRNSDDLVRAFEVLQTKNIDLTEATELTDERSKAAFLTLIQGVDSADKLSVALNNLDDNARKTAKTMLDNLAGDMKIATSAWEGLVQSIADGEGPISKVMRGLVQDFTDFLGTLTLFNETTIVNKLKLIANAALSLFETAFLPLLKVLELLGVEVPKFRFQVEKTTEALRLSNIETDFSVRLTKEQKKALEDAAKAKALAEEETKELTKAEIAQNKALRDQNKAYKERSTISQQTVSSIGTPTSVGTTTGLNPVALNDMVNNQVANNNATARELELEAIQNEEDAKLAIREAGANAAVQLLSDIFASAQDERLAKINSDAEAEKVILQDRLDKGIISEEQFAKQVSDIEKHQRIESAKADKKKAQFDNGLATLIAVAKAGFITPAAIAIAIIGGIQALAIAATPIPKFAGGVETLDGPGTKTSDSIPAMLSKGERVVPANINEQLNGISNQDLPSLVNGAMLVDRNIKSNRQDSNMLLASLLMNGNKTSEQLLTAMLNGVSSYDQDGIRYVFDPRGGVKKFNV